MTGRKWFRVFAIALGATAVQAQTGPSSSSKPVSVPGPTHSDSNTTSGSSLAGAPAGSGCELHVFPARNFIAMNTGMLSGFGIVGALADVEAHKDKVKTVKELMADYLTPETQMAALSKVGLATTLMMPADTQVISEQPFPNADDVKRDPALKAKQEDANALEKARRRFTSSSAVCYAELTVPYVFYQKAAMYGTRVFTAFWFRDFRHGDKAPLISKGQVENHVPGFPAASSDQEGAAKAALIDAYGQDLKKWAELKLHKS
jgi:hypothetical protein